jgi:hypothetical protein
MSSDGKKGGKNQKPNQRGGGAPVITDPRFAKMHTNREFMKLPQQQQKKQVDDRFKAMLTDKKFKTVGMLLFFRDPTPRNQFFSEVRRPNNFSALTRKFFRFFFAAQPSWINMDVNVRLKIWI